MAPCVTAAGDKRGGDAGGGRGGGTRGGGMLSLERCGDQQHRRRACPEFVADRAKVLMLEVILFYKLNFTSKECFHAG